MAQSDNIRHAEWRAMVGTEVARQLGVQREPTQGHNDGSPYRSPAALNATQWAPILTGLTFPNCACNEMMSDQTKATLDMNGIRMGTETYAKLKYCAGPQRAMPEADDIAHSRFRAPIDSLRSHSAGGNLVVDQR
mmetsp:Transcript_70011/g.156008  ORF Transcript_70011/g.156008 Transcript_70011/m.156008 type:complete len:135 (-) Transcript_70011:18-422(-)|eukprot:CAMPEP_0181183752 /NCGR_PEP_ID=MMETSP1096-20121128/8595_1 /TAXON_ID=156174 ORGANISM="Chrysochromulina ericina, Strain CCMP281" /NCGR_SAMPLE_ID=MMETSP1096 /ASSEMBLY_ACC=CAM_ASM_000453 /LENGTH=134 /DNA_ID=CAMNT_0023272457 /DNA_START=400 /DNA_END=804 /DNA_ORIENTATION=-